MSTYSNRLQPALQNLLQCVVWFFHPISWCTMHISADVFGGRKSLLKPVMRQKTCNYIDLFSSVLSPEIVMQDVMTGVMSTAPCRILTRTRLELDAYIGGRSENNIKCVMHDDLGQKNQTTRYILPRHWLYEWFSQFHSRGTYSVLSRSLQF